MKSQHTPAPWEARDAGETWYTITTAEGEVIADLSDSAFTTTQDKTNAARAVACVNACEGIDDPAAALAAAREALAMQHVALDACLACIATLDPAFMPSQSPVWPAVVRGRAARALLTPAPARCTSTSTGHGHTGTWSDARNAGPCLTEYTCGGPNGCGRTFTIDSSD